MNFLFLVKFNLNIHVPNNFNHFSLPVSCCNQLNLTYIKAFYFYDYSSNTAFILKVERINRRTLLKLNSGPIELLTLPLCD